jgi:hypothetical protein
MFPYFRSDKVLNKILEGEHPLYYLAIENNNWWECFVTDAQDNFHDLMWALSDDDIFSAIDEVLGSLDETIKYTEEGAA